MVALTKREATRLLRAHCQCLLGEIDVVPQIATAKTRGFALDCQNWSAFSSGQDTLGSEFRLAIEVASALASCEGLDPATNFDFWSENLGPFVAIRPGLNFSRTPLPLSVDAFSHWEIQLINNEPSILRQLLVEFFRPLPAPWNQSYKEVLQILEPFRPRGSRPQLHMSFNLAWVSSGTDETSSEELAAMLLELDNELGSQRMRSLGGHFDNVVVSDVALSSGLIGSLAPNLLKHVQVVGIQISNAAVGVIQSLDPSWMQTLRSIELDVQDTLHQMPFLVGVCAGIPHSTRLLKLKITADGAAREETSRDDELPSWLAFALLHPHIAREPNSFRSITFDGEHFPGHVHRRLPVVMTSDSPLSAVAAKACGRKMKSNWMPSRLGSTVAVLSSRRIYGTAATDGPVVRVLANDTTLDLVGAVKGEKWVAVVVPWHGLGWVRTQDVLKGSMHEATDEIVRPPSLSKVKIRIAPLLATALAEAIISASVRTLMLISRSVVNDDIKLPLCRCRNLVVLKLVTKTFDLMNIVRGYDDLEWPLETLIVSTTSTCWSEDEFLEMLMDPKRVGAKRLRAIGSDSFAFGKAAAQLEKWIKVLDVNKVLRVVSFPVQTKMVAKYGEALRSFDGEVLNSVSRTKVGLQSAIYWYQRRGERGSSPRYPHPLASLDAYLVAGICEYIGGNEVRCVQLNSPMSILY